MECEIAYITTANEKEALNIGKSLVEEKLAACANIIPAVKSVYRWKGEVEKGSETVLIIKTRKELVSRIISRVKELHSYECPCVVFYSITDGNPDYLKWIHEQTDTSV